MLDAETMTLLEDCFHEFLIWVGYGTLVGLVAKAIMPGRDPGGAIATLLMGISGSVIGCGALLFFSDNLRVSPISGMGFVAATAGAFLLLFFYRMFSGSLFFESEDGDRFLHRRFRRRRRRTVDRSYDRDY